MESYIVRIELEESDPLIWRRVIMPEGATYKKLHDIIQYTTNFQSGYPNERYHLYEFDLTLENMIVTDNEEAYMEHMHYMKNKEYYEKRLESLSPESRQFEEKYQERLKISVKKPSGIKIDDYLKKHNVIRYNYDFGDDWWFRITLEKTVDDYYFGYPLLLDGENTAPPEDVGGIYGYYEFLNAYTDPDHPEHEHMKSWVSGSKYQEYNPDSINNALRTVSYGKTRRDKIEEEYFKLIKNKYSEDKK